MWSQIVLCLLVGFAYASNNPAWNVNQEYIYEIHGRTLTSHEEVSNQNTGIFIRAKLRIQPRSDGKLQALISNPEYTQVHAVLSNGWKTIVSDEELSWKSMPMSSKPFQIQMDNGRITNLVVSKDCTNWEANMIKSIVSLFQLNTNGENPINSQMNSLPDSNTNSGVFYTMEDTILGETATLYEIKPISDYKLLSSERQVRFYDFKQKRHPNGDVIEVIKHEDFSRNRKLPSYVFGFGDYLAGGNPATNQMGTYFSRASSSRAYLSGNLKRYEILYSKTENTIHFSPTMTTQQSTVVVSIMEAELLDVKSQAEKIKEISQPVELKNLVYTYDKPFAKQNQLQLVSDRRQPTEHIYDSSSENDYQYTHRTSYARLKQRRSERSIDERRGSNDLTNDEDYIQSHPSINEAPESPFLTRTTGYEGMSIKNSIDIVKEAENIAKKISYDLLDEERDCHEKVLERYVNLASLIRLMNAAELKQLSDKLYSKSSEGQEAATWIVVRDAIAETGTGPALVVIKELIENNKLGDEASQIVSSMANTVRQPTLEFMKTFFKVVKSNKVLSQWPLNETALISFTELIRKVYVNMNVSRSEFPVNSFGSFRTSEGKQFFRKEVIPYISEMLNNAVKKSETYKIHAYIRALGNIPDPRVLGVFKPYLEGKQQTSQFQRLLMVLSMEKLVETYPEEARAVFFRLYQNPAEDTAVKIASVLNIMRSRPTAQILKIMATNTNIEKNDDVNAVVKHSIEQLAALEGNEYTELREHAKLVRPLLTDKEYGLQNGANYLRSYVRNELMIIYQSSSQFVPNEDSYYPKGVRYTLEASLNGFNRKLINMQAIVSSVDHLIDIVYKQTNRYTEQYRNQKQHAQEQQNYPWSSQKIAKILNMKANEREQLEGFLYAEIQFPYRMFSFDNQTIEKLPEYIRQVEERFNMNRNINHYKLFNFRQMALALPTAMGIPFLYTYDGPVLIKTQGKTKAVAEPKLSQNDKIYSPNQIKVEAEMKITVSGKTQGRVTFIAPFEHQQYIAGFDKHWQFNTPKFSVEANVDLKQQRVEAEINLESENQVLLAHYISVPFTAKSDVTDFEPMMEHKNTKVLEWRNMHSYKKIISKKTTGIALEVEINHEREFVTLARVSRVIYNNGFIDGLAELWNDGSIQNNLIKISYIPEQSTVRKIKLISKYDQQYYQEPKLKDHKEWDFDADTDPSKRQKEIMEVVSNGISNVRVDALDTVIQMEGEKKVKYIVTAAAAKSNVDPKSRVRVCYKKISDDKNIENYEAHLLAESVIPNTNALEPQYALQNYPKVDTKIQVMFGPSKENQTKISAQFEHSRSQERKKYLQDSPMYEVCKQEMRQGNKQLSACYNVTIEAGLLDRIQVKFASENLNPELEDAIQIAYNAVQVYLLPNLEVFKKQQNVEKDAVAVDIKFHPDLLYVNVSIKTQNEERIVRNIGVNKVARNVFVAHPVFHLRERILSQIYGVSTYRDFCTVDQNAIKTFSNRTYSVKVSNQWTVMAQFVPKEAREHGEHQQKSVVNQLNNQLENHVVLVRQNMRSSDKKDVKIVVSSPYTDFEVVEIDMTPSQRADQKAEVRVNGQPIEVRKDTSKDIKDGYIQIYAIPNGEVKVEVYYNFYVIYDGQRVRMSAVNGKLKDATRGVCGVFNKQDSEDFLTSENCIARDPMKFVKSFEVEGNEGQTIRRQFASDDKQCVRKVVPLYVNVIIDDNARRQSSSDYNNRESYESSSEQGRTEEQQDCLIHQTKYVEENGKICFTTVTLPSCKKNCQVNDRRFKTVGVHCLQQSRVAQLWKNQIDNGGSPDFSNKKQHKAVRILAAENCFP